MFSSGSLQYVYPKQLKEFFSQISNYNIELYILEPSDRGINEKYYRGNFSWLYNYEKYAKEVGFKTKVNKFISKKVEPIISKNPNFCPVSCYYVGDLKE